MEKARMSASSKERPANEAKTMSPRMARLFSRDLSMSDSIINGREWARPAALREVYLNKGTSYGPVFLSDVVAMILSGHSFLRCVIHGP